jgi:hypothetical protein
MGDNFSRLDLVIAIALAAIIAAWLITYAALTVMYGHDRSAKRAGHGEWHWEATAQIRETPAHGNAPGPLKRGRVRGCGLSPGSHERATYG